MSPCQTKKHSLCNSLNAGCWSVAVYAWSNYTDIDSLEEWEAMSEDEKNEAQMKSKQKLVENSGAHYIAYDLRDMPLVIEGYFYLSLSLSTQKHCTKQILTNV